MKSVDLRMIRGADGFDITFAGIQGETVALNEVMNRIFFNPLHTWSSGVNLWNMVNGKRNPTIEDEIEQVVSSVPGLSSAEISATDDEVNLSLRVGDLVLNSKAVFTDNQLKFQ